MATIADKIGNVARNEELGDFSDEYSVSTVEYYASTTAAVKESNFQASFAEQTASEMKQILEFWGSQLPSCPGLQKKVDRKSLDLMEERTQARRSTINTPPSKHHTSLSGGGETRKEISSPTNTVETTETSDSESEASANLLVEDIDCSFRSHDDSLINNNDDEMEPPEISCVPSFEVLEQRSQVDFIIKNTEKQGWEAEQTFHFTKLGAVLAELQAKLELKSLSSNADTDELSTMSHLDRSRLVTKTILRLLFRFILFPVVFSFAVALLIENVSENRIRQ
eukprot:scaffold19424_cov142-Cylindrotheca_fusiformis.AAC.12